MGGNDVNNGVVAESPVLDFLDLFQTSDCHSNRNCTPLQYQEYKGLPLLLESSRCLSLELHYVIVGSASAVDSEKFIEVWVLKALHSCFRRFPSQWVGRDHN